MTTASEMICYIQPVTAQAAGTAWVDTAKTAVVRRIISSKAEAIAVTDEARTVARAMGGGMAIKKLARSVPGARRPAGVKALQGGELVA